MKPDQQANADKKYNERDDELNVSNDSLCGLQKSHLASDSFDFNANRALMISRVSICRLSQQNVMFLV